MKERQQANPIERADVRSEAARAVIRSMEVGDTPWQRPWSGAAFRPVNLVTGNAYRGINRVLLALAAAGKPGLFMTYRQAAERGWQVRAGERGSMIVKLVDLDRAQEQGLDDGSAAIAAGQPSGRKALRRYFVFNAEQVDGVPRELLERPAVTFDPVARAEGVMRALVERTGLALKHGFDPCYIPAVDEVRLPPRTAFCATGAWGYHSVALHEAAHSTLHAKRLDRREALAGRWGDGAYAMEELRAEIASAILAAETGVPMSQASIDNHAAYLRSWIQTIERDPTAIFSAARDAERMADYLLALERELASQPERAQWAAAYEREEERALGR
jgi:antirestriction protein ArdC